MPRLRYELIQTSPRQSSAPALAPHMLALMLRNVASDGYVFADPLAPGRFSQPGCIIASPSYPSDLGTVDQDYVFNWTRDAAIAAMELAAANLPAQPGAGPQALVDYVNFASVCQSAGRPISRGCFTIEGEPRPWSDQSDGPALRVLAILQAYEQLDPAAQAVAREVAARDLDYLLGAYQGATTNLWEEKSGWSFFARAVQLRCLREVAANTIGVPAPGGVPAAIGWLENALPEHWNGRAYVSMLDPAAAAHAPAPAPPPDYDPNLDVVMAAVYGAIPVTDPKLLATAALLRGQWADPGSPSFYPINGADAARGIGPLVGRYPGDTYDGDMRPDQESTDHPWALCTCNFAELYCRVANAIAQSGAVPGDPLAAPFLAQVGVEALTPPAEAAAALRGAADAMLAAVVFHSDHLELSEQFDGVTGYEKSVRDLTWSYAAFLSAVRARTNPAIV